MSAIDPIFEKNKNYFSTLFSSVCSHQVELQTLNVWWDKVSLVGKINSLNVPQSLLSNMLETKEEFAELQQVLIDNLINEQLQQYQQQNGRIAQTLVDIPNRNLFERTADVGFLATDTAIIEHLNSTSASLEACQRISLRLQEYAAKYSVYDDILLFDSKGQLCVSMTASQPNKELSDPVIAQAITGNEEYLEICRYSDLFPNKNISSLFVAPIKDPHSLSVIGVLCMSFKLEDEMSSLFEDVNGSNLSVCALLDSTGQVIASNNAEILPIHSILTLTEPHQVILVSSTPYLASLAKTKGYQGYMGLGWQGCVLLPLSMQVNDSANVVPTEEKTKWKGFSKVLSNIQHNAKIVTEDLGLVVLNGRIAAARSDADEFIPILEEIRNIGKKMQHIFTSSVSELMDTALASRFNMLKFQAAQAIDIMDRNLYERANDCRWWALTDALIHFLSAEQQDKKNQDNIKQILAYINGLYTVYQVIYIFDDQGVIREVSHREFDHWIGRNLPDETQWQETMKHTNAQQYSVSPFVSSELYDNRPTYIYNAAIRKNERNVGGIGIVFDSEPEFSHILTDVIGHSVAERISIFVNREGMIISVSNQSPWRIGDTIPLPSHIYEAACGEKGSGITRINNDEYIVGYAVSKGYREFKTSDEYQNDIIALVLERNKSME